MTQQQAAEIGYNDVINGTKSFVPSSVIFYYFLGVRNALFDSQGN